MTQTTSSSTPSIAQQNVIPSEVGWQFVPQYYTFVNKQPNRLHCFYTKNSTFIHGTEGEDGRPCFGQQEIHAKILSLGFNDCKVFIHSVDAQASQGGGIIIQVIGEMSNNGEPWKKFVQTFFLAEQPNGYFVLNDIFRFLKEESVESEEGSEMGVSSSTQDFASASSPAPSAPLRVEEDQQPLEQHIEPAPAPAVSPAPAPAPAPQVEPAPEAAPVPVEEPSKPHLNGHVVEPEHQQTVDYTASPPAPAPAQEAEHVRPLSPPALSSPTTTATIASPPPTHSIPPTTPAPAPPTQLQQSSAPVTAPVTSAPAAPAAPKTWANLAAANSKKWGAAVAQESRGTSEFVVPSPPASGTQTPVTAHAATSRAPAPSVHQHVHPITTSQVFVKGVIESVTAPILTKVMTERFGPLKDLDVVHSKACAFFDFLSLDSARRAIAASLPVNQGGEGGIRIDVGSGAPVRITVETRKERNERPPPRPRGGPPSQVVAGGGGFRGRGAPRGRGSVSGKAL